VAFDDALLLLENYEERKKKNGRELPMRMSGVPGKRHATKDTPSVLCLGGHLKFKKSAFALRAHANYAYVQYSTGIIVESLFRQDGVAFRHRSFERVKCHNMRHATCEKRLNLDEDEKSS
jgi:hypothetical protein